MVIIVNIYYGDHCKRKVITGLIRPALVNLGHSPGSIGLYWLTWVIDRSVLSMVTSSAVAGLSVWTRTERDADWNRGGTGGHRPVF